jgi:DNA invertase Pin-like site-specific DNA recombinase
MTEHPTESDQALRPLETRALIYLWDDPAVAAVCRMDGTQQQQRCEAWAAARLWPVPELLRDGSAAEASATRPALLRLRQAIEQRACEVLIIPALISLGPAVADILQLLELVARCGMDLVSLHEHLDTTSAHGSYALLVLRALAQIATGADGTAVSAHPAAASSRLATARPSRSEPRIALPYGYRQTADGIAIDPATAPIVRRIFRLHDAGATLAELVQLLRDQGGGRWSQRMLAAVLAHETAYRGGPHPDGGHWPPLLEQR